MSNHVSDLLDEALQGSQTHDVQTDPLRATEINSLLDTVELLAPLQEVDWPSPTIRVADRRHFLDQVAYLPEPAARDRFWAWLPGWMTALLLWLKGNFHPGREENKPMTTLAKMAFAFVALFGLTGGSVVVASTNSLPDSWLYDVKLATEDVRVALSDGEAGTAQLYLDLAQERLEEMERLVARGAQPDTAVLERLRTQLRESTRAAAGAPTEEIPGLLRQLRAQVRTQTTAQAMSGDPTLAAAWQFMRQYGEELENGAREPQQFQHRHASGAPDEWPCGDGQCEPAGEQFQYGPGEPGHGPGEPGGNPDCPDGCEPAGEQHQYGPGEAGSGPGEPGGNPDCPDGCEPAGEQHQYGPGEAGSGPGEPGGNPDCPDGCEPAGEQHQFGPGEAGSGPGEPGGNPDCPDGCEPAGEQHQYGPGEAGSGPGEPGGAEERNGPRP